MPHVLFVHRHGPGQFVHLARHLAAAGNEVTMLCESHDRTIAGVELITHDPAGPNPAGGTSIDYQMRLGARAAEAMERFRRRRDVPDLVVGHSGWGSLLHARDVFPSTPLLAYCEHYYRAKGADVGFDPLYPVKSGDVGRLKVRNFAQVQALLDADAGLSPTHWQKGGFPEVFQPRIGVIHEGVDTAFCRPDPAAKFVLPDGRTVKAGDPVITFAARHLEPYRGFPQFMRAAAKLGSRDPAAVFLVAGADGAGYGAAPRNGLTWRETLMRETGMDPSRIHFLGTLAHEHLIRLFQVSAAHVYLTYPFVLSWSMLEAMASGVLLIGSTTPPVEEFVTDGDNGILVPFFDEDRLAQILSTALAGLPNSGQLRQAARKTVVDRLQISSSLKRQSDLLARLIRGRS